MPIGQPALLKRILKFGSRKIMLATLLAAPFSLSACVSFSDLDPSLSPSSSPVIADNVRSGRLARLGAAQHPRILAAYGGEYSNVKLERMVAGIVGELVTVSDNPTQVYQISILDSPVVNAFALPGGYLYVSRGLLALASDSAELAAVIAHEMAHVTANHGVLRQQREQEAVLAQRIVSDVLRDKEAGRRALVRGRLELAQFSRNQELEADAIGIAAIGEAGYDPYAAAEFQQHMAAFNTYRSAAGVDNNNGLDFLSTHPSTPQRVALAVGHARKFGSPGVGARDREAYLRGIDGMLYGDSEAEGFVRGQTYSHVNLGITFTFPQGFDIENQPAAVLGGRPSDGSAIRFDGDNVPANQNLTQYIASGWVEGLDPNSVRQARINGLEAATARASIGRWDFDVTVVRANGEVYRILTAVPAGSGELDAIANQIKSSFRTLTPAEKAQIKPLKIRIVEAKPSDTVATMGRKMTGSTKPQQFFTALNGMAQGERLVPGQFYKIVTE